MIAPLTPEQKAELNAWIAEQVYDKRVRWDSEFVSGPVTYDDNTRSWFMVDNYTDDWSAAGPLFDRHTFTLDRCPNLYRDGVTVYQVFGADAYSSHTLLAEGTTGPEAIAKAVRAYEEGEQR